jgi:Fic-DOC domain mobile mystery protein B
MAVWPQIPGETPIDPSGLKVRGITNRAELNPIEAENILKAVTKYMTGTRKVAFDFPLCLRVHEDMFGDVWDWAGKLRQENFNIGIPFAGVSDSLAALLDDLHSWSGYKMGLVEQSTRLHHIAVKIHPFNNGNGRWSRLLANMWLRQNGHPVIEWPEKVIGDRSVVRDEYIAAIRLADDGDYGPLLAMHQKYVGLS